MRLSSLFPSLLDLLYPVSCIHCHTFLKGGGIFCPSCLSLFVRIDPKERCTTCFRHLFEGICPCSTCYKPPSFKRLASCFPGEGPAKSLAISYQKEKSPKRARDLAAHLIVQMENLGFPPFDLVTFFPGYLRHIDALLAKEVASMLGVKCKVILSKEVNGPAPFFLKKRDEVEGKMILLVSADMEMEQMDAAACQLHLGDLLYGIAFCSSSSSPL